MLEKDKLLEKTNYLIFLIFIFFSPTLVAETNISKILNLNAIKDIDPPLIPIIDKKKKPINLLDIETLKILNPSKIVNKRHPLTQQCHLFALCFSISQIVARLH